MPDFLLKTDSLLTIFDILLVSFVIYRLFRLVRESTAIRVLLVLPVVITSYLLARLAGLVTFTWLLDNFLSSLLLILVVIFQYDIRRAMLSFKRGSAAKTGEHDPLEKESAALLDQLVAAAHSLSERRNGALIVIEREMSLDHFMAVGTEVDAKVTSELISSIFLPYSPIHDGAVIIQHGKLTQAGCFLPLTHNPEVAKELGTRHRAAIGLTELVDALVIVVSEETGSISFVSGGKITSNLEPAALRKILRRMVDSRWAQ